MDPWNGLGMMLVEGFFVAQPETRVRDGRIWNVEVLLLRTENLKVATSSNCLFPSWFVNARRSNTPFDVARYMFEMPVITKFVETTTRWYHPSPIY